MQNIKNIPLPKQLPTDQALKSCRQNIHNYEPEAWEFQYEIHRYLKNISDEELIQRHENLCKNFIVYNSEDRDKIPINSFQSSWYWFRKEHQTRYEFLLRKLPLPDSPKSRGSINKPYSREKPTSCDVLYRCGHLEPITSLYKFGQTKIKPASAYKDGIASDPRTDDEKTKERWYVGDYTTITTQNGEQMPIIDDVKSTVSACDYYVLCLSCDYEPLIFEEFDYNSCLIIKKPEKFASRLESKLKEHLPDWYFHHNPIQYFDPFEHTKNEYFSPTMCKDFSFAYQMEYRYILDPLKPMNEIKELSTFKIELGSLEDISELHVK